MMKETPQECFQEFIDLADKIIYYPAENFYATELIHSNLETTNLCYHHNVVKNKMIAVLKGMNNN